LDKRRRLTAFMLSCLRKHLATGTKKPGQHKGCPGKCQRRAGRQKSLDRAGHAPGRAHRQFRRN